MLTIKYKEGEWHEPHILPYGDISISPAASGLHYGLQCFEGTKAYRDACDPEKIRMFRPDCNMERMNDSMRRLSMPAFPSQQFLACIEELIRTDSDWIPPGENNSLYIRPTAVSTHPYVGLATSTEILLYCICCPVGPYYAAGGFEPVRLLAVDDMIRAWPGGTGNTKVGGNYGPTMAAQAQAVRENCDQVLWIFGEDEAVTEVGSMNVFFVFENKETGRKELVTPPLDRGDILPGVTRRSILDLARSWNDIDVVERSPTMSELAHASEEGCLLEAFGAGTAAVVTPISGINYKGRTIEIKSTWKVTRRVYKNITDIQYGREEGPDGWSYTI